jgi:uncharacterized membrane protein (UPF0127 family)
VKQGLLPSVIGLALAALVLVAASAPRSQASAVGTLTLDGVEFRPELALTSEARARGLMQRRPAPVDGMLFVFGQPTSGGFWMKNTLVPLRIVFFDAAGNRVRQLSMKPCRADPCPTYDPGRLYRFALELRSRDPRAALKLGPLRELRRLVRRAA